MQPRSSQPSNRSPPPQEDLPRWRAILRQLRLCPAQLEALVAVHSEYLAMVRPALEERRPVLHALRQVRCSGPLRLLRA